MDGIACDGIDDGLLLHHLLVLVGGDVLAESAEQGGLGLGGHEVPHLGLAALAPLSVGNLVGGVHLYGEVVACIDELDEQRELVAEALVVGFAHQRFLLLGDEFVETTACIGPFADDGFVALHAADFPALAYFAKVGLDVFERGNLRAAPDGVLKDGSEFVHFSAP